MAPMPTTFAEATRQLGLNSLAKRRSRRVQRHWRMLKPSSVSARKARLTIREDDSILAGGETADGDAIRSLSQTDEPVPSRRSAGGVDRRSLPSRGPGRAENGNFALTDVRLFAAPRAKPSERSDQSAGGAGRLLANQPRRLAGRRGDLIPTAAGRFIRSSARHTPRSSSWTSLWFHRRDALTLELTQGERHMPGPVAPVGLG